MPTFRTKLKHNTSTVIEVFGEFFTFTGGIGLLTTETPAVIERLRAIPEGFEELGGQADNRQRAILPPAPAAPLPPPAEVPPPLEQLPTAPPEGQAADAPPANQLPAGQAAGSTDARPFVLRNEAGTELDLALLDDDQLRAFVVDNGLKVPGRAKGDTLRKAIHAALQPAA
ncbi:hypothetical protein MW290_25510 [Aquincola tertiaricarbonis]|uniref:Uncharacterized protein n=1 Tax=Aquincola tertiaricarbonis TaxID=391953 RepID=A0ABY4S7G1_AQUTE|nr:hypothetical protein [Aquincola tertiaricarbonis]URI08929.1 hypothetical protein MW290_25510 [Aquincola tertiaricarbonis]